MYSVGQSTDKLNAISFLILLGKTRLTLAKLSSTVQLVLHKCIDCIFRHDFIL